MERSVLVLLCLSAAVCIASAIDLCPDDLFTDRLKYMPEGHVETTLLVRKICRFNLAALYPQYFSGTVRYVNTYIHVCTDGLVPLKLPEPDLYLCEVEGAVVEPAEDDSEPEVAPVEPTNGALKPEVAPVEPTNGALNIGTTEPTDSPTTASRPTASSTTSPGELPECPSGSGYGRNNYVYSSLNLIERRSCFIRIRIQGAPSTKNSQVWVCKAGYERVSERRGQFSCKRL